VSACWSGSNGQTALPDWTIGRLLIEEAHVQPSQGTSRGAISAMLAQQPGLTWVENGTERASHDAMLLRVRLDEQQVALSLRPLHGQGVTYDVAVALWDGGSTPVKTAPQEAVRRGWRTILAMHALDRAGEEALRGALVPDLADMPVSARLERAALKGFAMRRIGERRDLGAIDALFGAIAQANDAQGTPIDQGLALRAIGTLVALGDQRAVEPLIDLAQHKEPDFVLQVAYAVGALGGRTAKAYLVTLGSGHMDPEVRAGAAIALNEMLERRRAVPS
jgi:hypothetical protein